MMADRRRSGPSLVLAIGLVLVLLAFSVVAYLFADNVLEHLKRRECADELAGQAWGALGRSLGAPPAPSPERGIRTEDLIRAATRVERTHELCSDGYVGPFRQSPIPTVATVPPSS